MRDLDVSGCRDLAVETATHQEGPGNPLSAALKMLLGSSGNAGSSCCPSAQACDLHGSDVPVPEGCDEHQAVLPSFRRLVIGWGFRGGSIRWMLSNSAVSLVTLEVIGAREAWGGYFRAQCFYDLEQYAQRVKGPRRSLTSLLGVMIPSPCLSGWYWSDPD